MNIPCLVIAGTHSGAGKTTVTVGLCGALRRLGLRVAVFKCGPDYLDPTWHFRAAGVRSETLDGWMMGREAVLSTFRNAVRDADVALIEGVMGLFDGVEPTSDLGSTAEIAKWLDAPVLLVVDAMGMSRSVAAIVAGFAAFDPAVRIGGLICNRVGSRGHLDILRRASASVPVLGGLPRNHEIAFPERHLGLHTADDVALASSACDRWAEQAAEWCDLEKIMALARSAATHPALPSTMTPENPTRCRIGLAFDEAFHFYYGENLRLLQRAGAEIVKFSPLRDQALPQVDALYLGGGYPEVRADALARNESLRCQIYDFCAMGKPVYAECGGLMYLCSGIRLGDGSRHAMVGWFGADAVMAGRLQALGYVEAETSQPSILGPAGQRFRGHQFRYSTLEWREASDTVYTVTTRRNGASAQEGYTRLNVVGSYIHAHWASSPSVPENLVAATACSVASNRSA